LLSKQDSTEVMNWQDCCTASPECTKYWEGQLPSSLFTASGLRMQEMTLHYSVTSIVGMQIKQTNT